MKKRILAGALALSILSTSYMNAYAQGLSLNYDGKTHVYEATPITLYINNKKIQTTLMPPIQMDGRVLVPAREVFSPMGADVEWKAYEQKAYITYQDQLMILQPNQKEVWLNGETIQLDVPAKVINEKIMLPVRFVSEAMGFKVKWVGGSTPAVYITDQEENTPSLDHTETKSEEELASEGETKDSNGSEVVQEDNQDKEDNQEDKTDDQESQKDDEQAQVNGILKEYTGTINDNQLSISKQNFSQTNIQKVDVTTTLEGALCIITAESELTGADISLQDGKVIVDIQNSINKLAASTQAATNLFVERIRTSQFTADTTRVVLDLKSGANVNAELSQDRKQILIYLIPQNLEKVTLGTDEDGDYISFKNIVPSQLQVQKDFNNQTIKVTIPNTQIEEVFSWGQLNGLYINKIEAEQNANKAVLTISLDPAKKCVHNISYLQRETVIRIAKPTFKNIDYSISQRGSIEIKKSGQLSATNIVVKDQYNDRKLIIDLKADYASHLGYGTFEIGDSQVKQIEITTQNTTKLTVNTQKVQAFNIREDQEKIYIDLIAPRDKYSKIVVIDPGHGGSDSGALGHGLKEKNLNLKEALAVRKLLEQNTNIKVYMTRVDDTTLTLAYRTELANEIEADAFISFHNNSAGSAIKGTEVYYYGTSSQGKAMAQMIQGNIIKYCQTVDRKIKDGSGLYVIRTSKMPSVLIESGFISNYEEAMRLNSDDFNQKLATAIYEAIVEMFDTLSFR